jgi:hypothetical protein
MSDFYIFPGSFCLYVLQPKRKTNPENEQITHRYMIAGIGNKTMPFHFGEYINRIFGTVQTHGTAEEDDL